MTLVSLVEGKGQKIWLRVVFKAKMLDLQYMLLLSRFYVFFWKSKNATFLRFLLSFTRFLELWPLYNDKSFHLQSANLHLL